MKKIKISNLTSYNALLVCAIAFVSQIPRQCGYISVYAVPLLWLLLILNSAFMTYILIRFRETAEIKNHWKAHRRICVCTLVICIALSYITVPFVEDSIKGTEIITTIYYQIFSKSNELLIYYPDWQDKTIYLTKLQLEYIDNNYNEIDKNRTMKVSDAMSVYAHTKAITIEFYPNSGIVKYIEIEP